MDKKKKVQEEKEQLKAKQDKILAEKKEEREKARQEFLRNKKMASTGANRAEGQVDAKGGVKFELVGIPEVMLEESKEKKRKTVENDDRLLVFDMGSGSEAKKPVLGGKKQSVSTQGKKVPGKQ